MSELQHCLGLLQQANISLKQARTPGGLEELRTVEKIHQELTKLETALAHSKFDTPWRESK